MEKHAFYKGSGSLAISRVSVIPSRYPAFKYFLFFMIAVAAGAASIENGLNPFALTALALVFAAARRHDYAAPFLWSERTGTILFFVYIPISVIAMLMFPGGLSLPTFITYFTYGLLLVRALSPLTDRNIWQVVFLSIGLVLVNCILTNHMLFGLILPAFLFFLMGTLSTLQQARSSNPVSLPVDQPLQEKRGHGLLLKCSLAVTVGTVLFFVLFPRPFLVIPGLRGAMERAGFAELAQNISYRDMMGMSNRKRIAFAVQMEKGALPDFPYWRGRVLERTDGSGWYPAQEIRTMMKPIEARNDQVTIYKVIPYRLQSKYVYVSGLPVRAAGRAGRPLYLTSEAEVTVDSPFQISEAYRVTTVNRPAAVAMGSVTINLSKTGLTPRIERAAREWTASQSTPQDKAAALAERLRNEYTYLQSPPPPPETSHPIEHFLFVSKEGHCEYFAGALAIMLRSLGIPARVVDGFAGMERAETKGEFLVRFSRAHAWVEASLDRKTWSLLDATPASSMDSSESYWKRALLDTYDAVQYRWIKYVVYFDRGDQSNLFNSALNVFKGKYQFGAAVASGLWKYVVLFAGSVVLLLVALVLRRREKKRRDHTAVYLSVLQDLMKLGVPVRFTERHECNCSEIGAKAPALEPAFRRFTEAYLALRFGGATDPTELHKAKRELLGSASS